MVLNQCGCRLINKSTVNSENEIAKTSKKAIDHPTLLCVICWSPLLSCAREPPTSLRWNKSHKKKTVPFNNKMYKILTIFLKKNKAWILSGLSLFLSSAPAESDERMGKTPFTWCCVVLFSFFFVLFYQAIYSFDPCNLFDLDYWNRFQDVVEIFFVLE